jgi:hypothetical protein
LELPRSPAAGYDQASSALSRPEYLLAYANNIILEIASVKS